MAQATPDTGRPDDGPREPTISFGGLDIDFLRSRHGAGGGVDLFTTAVRPGAGVPIPHHHGGWDETVYGLSGVVTWRIADREVAVGAGQSAFIPHRAP